MWLLARRNLASRPARTLLTGLAIALGVGMIFAMRMVGAEISRSAQTTRENRLTGADLEISATNSAHFSAEWVDRLADEPDILSAAPVFRAAEGAVVATDVGASGASALVDNTILQGTDLALLGVDPANTLSAYELTAGRFLNEPQAREVLLPQRWATAAGLQVGHTVTLVTGNNQASYAIVGLLAERAAAGPAPPTAWLPLRTLQSAFNQPGLVSAILIRVAEPDRLTIVQRRLQEQLGSQFVVTSSSGGSRVRSLFTLTELALPFAGLVVLLAGSFFVFNAFAISLAERRREIGLLRILGMTRSQIRRQILLEALLVAVGGAGGGLLLGWLLGQTVTRFLATLQGNELDNVPLPADAAPLAVGTGIVITLAVALSLAWSAGRLSPLVALAPERRSARQGRRRPMLAAGAGILLLVVAFTLPDVIQQQAARNAVPGYEPMGLAALLISAAALALLPAWVMLLLTGVQWLGRWPRLAGWGPHWGRLQASLQLASGTLQGQGLRAYLTAAILTVSLAILLGLAGVTLYFRTFLFEVNQGLLNAEYALIRPFPPQYSFEEIARLPALPPVPAELQSDLATLEEVADIAYYANVSLPGLGVESGLGDQYAFALSLNKARSSPIFPATEGDWETAETIFAAGPAIMLPELTARRLDKHPGDVIEIATLEGPVPFTIALVGGGFPIVTPEVAQTYFGSHPFGFLVDPRPNVDPARLERELEALIGRHPGELAFVEVSQIEDVVDALGGPIVGLFIGLTSLSTLIAALSIMVTLIASVLERQRQLGTLRALGMPRSQLQRLIVFEAGLLALTGAILGVLAGLAISYLFGRLMINGIEILAGIRPVDGPPLPWQIAASALLLSPMIAALTALYPARRAARANPAMAMRVEGAAGFVET